MKRTEKDLINLKKAMLQNKKVMHHKEKNGSRGWRRWV